MAFQQDFSFGKNQKLQGANSEQQQICQTWGRCCLKENTNITRTKIPKKWRLSFVVAIVTQYTNSPNGIILLIEKPHCKVSVYVCAVRSPLISSQVTSRLHNQFSEYPKWLHTFCTDLVFITRESRVFAYYAMSLPNLWAQNTSQFLFKYWFIFSLLITF